MGPKLKFFWLVLSDRAHWIVLPVINENLLLLQIPEATEIKQTEGSNTKRKIKRRDGTMKVCEKVFASSQVSSVRLFIRLKHLDNWSICYNIFFRLQTSKLEKTNLKRNLSSLFFAEMVLSNTFIHNVFLLAKGLFLNLSQILSQTLIKPFQNLNLFFLSHSEVAFLVCFILSPYWKNIQQHFLIVTRNYGPIIFDKSSDCKGCIANLHHHHVWLSV